MTAPQFGLVFPPEVIDSLAAHVAERVARELGHKPTEEYLTVPEAAAVMRTSPKRVYELTGRGLLGKVNDGSRVLVPRTAIDRYLQGHDEASAAA